MCACAGGGASGTSDGKVFLFGPRKPSNLLRFSWFTTGFLSAFISVGGPVSASRSHVETVSLWVGVGNR